MDFGLLPPGTQFDLFRGTAAMKQDGDDMYPTTLGHTINFGKKKVTQNVPGSHQMGSSLFLALLMDLLSFLQIWDHASGKLKKDLQLLRDSEMLASGSQDGKIKNTWSEVGEIVKGVSRTHVICK